MGVAAYQRGTALNRREFDNAARDRADGEVIDRLNRCQRGSRTPFQATVIRKATDGQWWIMNRARDGWGEFGYPYESLRELFATWNVFVVGLGKDKHSFFYSVIPGRG